MFRYLVLLILFVSLVPIIIISIQFFGNVSTLKKLRPIYNPCEPIRYFNLTHGSSGHGQIINDVTKCKKYSTIDRARAVGGIHSFIGEIPSMVLLEYLQSDGHYSVDCSGSLINQRYVLAATHCLNRSNLINVRLGEYDTVHNPDCDMFADCQPEPIVVAVEEIVLHQNYDIGLIRLSVEVQYREFFIAPICVPTPNDNVDSRLGDRVWSAGWGHVTKFYIIFVRIVDCFNKNSRFQICADGQLDRNYCNRDPNGPLIVTHNEALYIEGIKSFGDACGRNGSSMAVYTRVSYFYHWIIENLKP